MKRSLNFLNVSHWVSLFSKFFMFSKHNNGYWVGKEAIVHSGVFGLDITIIRTGPIAPPQYTIPVTTFV